MHAKGVAEKLVVARIAVDLVITTHEFSVEACGIAEQAVIAFQSVDDLVSTVSVKAIGTVTVQPVPDVSLIVFNEEEGRRISPSESR